MKTRCPSTGGRSTASRLAVALACVSAFSQPARAAAQTPAPSADGSQTPAPSAVVEQRPLADLPLEDLLKLKVATVFAAFAWCRK